MTGSGIYIVIVISCFFTLVLIFLSRSKPSLEVPKSLGSEITIPAKAKAIMQDVDTADFTVRCKTREFKVHKNFLCSRLVLKPATILIILFCSTPGLRSCEP